MRKIYLFLILSFVTTSLFGQNRYYNLTTQFDSVGVKRLKVSIIPDGTGTDSVLTHTANGQIRKVARSTFAGVGSFVDLTTNQSVGGTKTWTGNQFYTGDATFNGTNPVVFTQGINLFTPTKLRFFNNTPTLVYTISQPGTGHQLWFKDETTSDIILFESGTINAKSFKLPNTGATHITTIQGLSSTGDWNINTPDKAGTMALLDDIASVDSSLHPNKNLSDLQSKSQSRLNLNVYSQSEIDTKVQLKQPRLISALPTQTVTRPIVGDSVNKAFAKLVFRGDSISTSINGKLSLTGGTLSGSILNSADNVVVYGSSSAAAARFWGYIYSSIAQLTLSAGGNNPIQFNTNGITRAAISGAGIFTYATATAGTSTTEIASTAFVTTADNLKANLASPAFTGTPSLPTGTTGVTQAAGDNSTKLATTAFVLANAVTPIAGTPTISAGAGSGTSPTVSVTTNGKGLQVTVTTGTLPTGTNAVVGTVTLANALPYTPYPVFSSANGATSLLNGASMIYMTSSGSTNVTITSGTTALVAATTYIWNISL